MKGNLFLIKFDPNENFAFKPDQNFFTDNMITILTGPLSRFKIAKFKFITVNMALFWERKRGNDDFFPKNIRGRTTSSSSVLFPIGGKGLSMKLGAKRFL